MIDIIPLDSSNYLDSDVDTYNSAIIDNVDYDLRIIYNSLDLSDEFTVDSDTFVYRMKHCSFCQHYIDSSHSCGVSSFDMHSETLNVKNHCPRLVWGAGTWDDQIFPPIEF